MTPDKKPPLQSTLEAIRRRWGPDAVRQASAQRAAEPACLPTGFAALDRALALGGIPRGRITELVGAPTSGMTTLALTLIARAQQQGSQPVFIDLDHALDPAYAARCGVEVGPLLLARPRTLAERARHRLRPGRRAGRGDRRAGWRARAAR